VQLARCGGRDAERDRPPARRQQLADRGARFQACARAGGEEDDLAVAGRDDDRLGEHALGFLRARLGGVARGEQRRVLQLGAGRRERGRGALRERAVGARLLRRLLRLGERLVGHEPSSCSATSRAACASSSATWAPARWRRALELDEVRSRPDPSNSASWFAACASSAARLQQRCLQCRGLQAQQHVAFVHGWPTAASVSCTRPPAREVSVCTAAGSACTTPAAETTRASSPIAAAAVVPARASARLELGRGLLVEPAPDAAARGRSSRAHAPADAYARDEDGPGARSQLPDWTHGTGDGDSTRALGPVGRRSRHCAGVVASDAQRGMTPA
jgi:hypothetical protein